MGFFSTYWFLCLGPMNSCGNKNLMEPRQGNLFQKYLGISFEQGSPIDSEEKNQDSNSLRGVNMSTNTHIAGKQRRCPGAMETREKESQVHRGGEKA